MVNNLDHSEEYFDLSIVICTFNYIDILIECAVKSLLKQNLPSGIKYEILIVDNASTDNTRTQVNKIIEDYKHFPIRYVFESQRGLSNARNRGILESRGEIIAFLDNDAFADSNWIQTINDSFSKYQDAIAIGGKTIPVCKPPKPRWFSGRMLRYVGGHDFGPHDLLLKKGLYLQGANMAIKRPIFNKYGLFRNELGRSGNKNLSHEEGEFFTRIHKDKLKIYYVPKMLVYHYQNPERFVLKKLAETVFLSGWSESVVDLLHKGHGFVLLKSFKKFYLCILSPIIMSGNMVINNWSEVYFVLLRAMFGFGYSCCYLRQIAKGPFLRKLSFPSHDI